VTPNLSVNEDINVMGNESESAGGSKIKTSSSSNSSSSNNNGSNVHVIANASVGDPEKLVDFTLDMSKAIVVIAKDVYRLIESLPHEQSADSQYQQMVEFDELAEKYQDQFINSYHQTIRIRDEIVEILRSISIDLLDLDEEYSACVS